MFLIAKFSCARFVIASAARLATPPLPLRSMPPPDAPPKEAVLAGGLLMLCACRKHSKFETLIQLHIVNDGAQAV
jgi:hypothetical protein